MSKRRLADTRTADHQDPVDGRVDGRRLARTAAVLGRRVVAAAPRPRVVGRAGRQDDVTLVDEAALGRHGEGPASGSLRRGGDGPGRRPRALGGRSHVAVVDGHHAAASGARVAAKING